MSKIIEIWRKTKGLGIPVKFTVGYTPMVLTNDQLVGTPSPNVESINFYETGALGGKAYRGPCFVISFEDSDQRRIIPAHVVVDVCWENTPKEEKTQIPALED